MALLTSQPEDRLSKTVACHWSCFFLSLFSFQRAWLLRPSFGVNRELLFSSIWLLSVTSKVPILPLISEFFFLFRDPYRLGERTLPKHSRSVKLFSSKFEKSFPHPCGKVISTDESPLGADVGGFEHRQLRSPRVTKVGVLCRQVSTAAPQRG
jgi:hypothetical protein